VLAILILMFGAISVFKTPTDIFPPIKIPIIAAIWTYTGLMPTDMSAGSCSTTQLVFDTGSRDPAARWRHGRERAGGPQPRETAGIRALRQ
jgi:hypothetical protein